MTWALAPFSLLFNQERGHCTVNKFSLVVVGGEIYSILYQFTILCVSRLSLVLQHILFSKCIPKLYRCSISLSGHQRKFVWTHILHIKVICLYRTFPLNRWYGCREVRKWDKSLIKNIHRSDSVNTLWWSFRPRTVSTQICWYKPKFILVNSISVLEKWLTLSAEVCSGCGTLSLL